MTTPRDPVDDAAHEADRAEAEERVPARARRPQCVAERTTTGSPPKVSSTTRQMPTTPTRKATSVRHYLGNYSPQGPVRQSVEPGHFVLRLWRRRRESNPCTRFCRPLPEPLGHVATDSWLAAPRGFEPRFTDPKSAVLPLDDGASPRLTLAGQPRLQPAGHENGAEDGTRTRDPHLGKVMLYQLSHFRPPVRPMIPRIWCRGSESN